MDTNNNIKETKMFNNTKVYNKYNYDWSNKEHLRKYHLNYYHLHKTIKVKTELDEEHKKTEWKCDICNQVFNSCKSRHNNTKKHINNIKIMNGELNKELILIKKNILKETDKGTWKCDVCDHVYYAKNKEPHCNTQKHIKNVDKLMVK